MGENICFIWFEGYKGLDCFSAFMKFDFVLFHIYIWKINLFYAEK